MPWYPVKDYGDFSLKFQWRDSATGSNGNGGAFVRFPNPAEAVTRTAATRYPCQVGSGQTDQAWVAIYCGHEIQINDYQSRHAEDGLDLQLLAAQRHAGEGSAARYVGGLRDQGRRPDLHDHPQRRGAADVREHAGQDVLALGGSVDDGSPVHARLRRPAEPLRRRRHRLQERPRALAGRGFGARSGDGQSGNGAHTVEYRSTDVAGNVEATKKVDFTIGAAGGDTTAPVTTSALDAGDAGRGRDLQRSGQRAAVGHRSGFHRRWRRRAEDGRRQRVPGSLGAERADGDGG